MLASIETKLVKIEGQADALIWMTGALLLIDIAITAGTLWLLVRIAGKAGALG